MESPESDLDDSNNSENLRGWWSMARIGKATPTKVYIWKFHHLTNIYIYVYIVYIYICMCVYIYICIYIYHFSLYIYIINLQAVSLQKSSGGIAVGLLPHGVPRIGP